LEPIFEFVSRRSTSLQIEIVGAFLNPLFGPFGLSLGPRALNLFGCAYRFHNLRHETKALSSDQWGVHLRSCLSPI